MTGPRPETEIVEQLLRARLRLSTIQTIDHLRQRDVLKRRELWQQVMKLIDEADRHATQIGAFRVAHQRGRGRIDERLSTVRPLQEAGDMEQR